MQSKVKPLPAPGRRSTPLATRDPKGARRVLWGAPGSSADPCRCAAAHTNPLGRYVYEFVTDPHSQVTLDGQVPPSPEFPKHPARRGRLPSGSSAARVAWNRGRRPTAKLLLALWSRASLLLPPSMGCRTS